LGFQDFKLKLSGNYPSHEYCVQYRETDFAFVSRLMEEEGIFYYFRHENGKHTLVLADDATAYYELDDSQVEFGDPNHTSGNQDQIKEWQHGYSYQPGKFAHTDYNFKTPAKILMATENTVVNFANNKAFEVYDYHGRHRDTERGRALARVRMEALEVSHNVAHGESTYRSFSPGGKFKFERHRTRAEVGQSYLLSYVETLASLGDSYITGVGEGEFEFKNRFRCISADTVYRPPSDTPKPVVEGPQTAVVVGPAGEEIYTDEHSRVKVQFHWDREGRKDEYSSCWIRVSQAHAGKGWGYIDIPRIGEAVIVDFLEGDPDAPIIIGRVYNANVMPPFPLDGKTTRRTKPAAEIRPRPIRVAATMKCPWMTRREKNRFAFMGSTTWTRSWRIMRHSKWALINRRRWATTRQ
ncbi:MAG: type VI secretion system tip protein VgrG, partial [Pirellulales bacterium]|nr:type VI secretion system tip protein VgrG [Pirellulales bacterium]